MCSFLPCVHILFSLWYLIVVAAMCAGTLLMSKLLLMMESPTRSGMATAECLMS